MDRFHVQVGARDSHIRQDYAPIWTGPLVNLAFPGPSPFIPPPATVSANALTYLFTPEFKLSPDLMVYARFASGYRPGGDNVNSTAHSLPSYAPDKTENYEIGAKGDVLDHKLSFDASVYYIDWKDIQIQTVSPTTHTALFINGTRAKSQGVEFSAESRPLQGLKISAWVAWNDAVLTQALPIYGAGALYGPTGSRLPFSSRISSNFSIDQTFRLMGRASGFIGGAVSYVGDRLGNFLSIPERQNLPGYARTDLRAGVMYESWKVNFFVNNVTNKRAFSQGGAPGEKSVFVVIQPRIAGVIIAKTF
jgi:outer membrane receptor protein involved in Fe transport